MDGYTDKCTECQFRDIRNIFCNIQPLDTGRKLNAHKTFR